MYILSNVEICIQLFDTTLTFICNLYQVYKYISKQKGKLRAQERGHNFGEGCTSLPLKPWFECPNVKFFNSIFGYKNINTNSIPGPHLYTTASPRYDQIWLQNKWVCCISIPDSYLYYVYLHVDHGHALSSFAFGWYALCFILRGGDIIY